MKIDGFEVLKGEIGDALRTPEFVASVRERQGDVRHLVEQALKHLPIEVIEVGPLGDDRYRELRWHAHHGGPQFTQHFTDEVQPSAFGHG